MLFGTRIKLIVIGVFLGLLCGPLFIWFSISNKIDAHHVLENTKQALAIIMNRTNDSQGMRIAVAFVDDQGEYHQVWINDMVNDAAWHASPIGSTQLVHYEMTQGEINAYIEAGVKDQANGYTQLLIGVGLLLLGVFGLVMGIRG